MHEINHILRRIETRDFTVGVIGLGYVGLPLLLRFAEVGFLAIGFDIDAGKVDMLNQGRSYIDHIPGERVAKAVQNGTLSAGMDFGRLSEADALIICVPTPLNRFREPNLEFVEQTAAAIGARIRRGQLVCLESTTYPGTTEEILLPRLSAQGLQVGQDFFLAYSPEREDPGNRHFSTATIPKIVGGVTPACQEVACTLYGAVVDKVVPVSSPQVAEAAKMLENIYRAVNIALVNELKVVLDRMGIDVWEVIEAARTKPFGFQPFFPGPGLGGHCIPIDPFYLTWKAREYGVATRFIELAGEVNTAMPAYVVTKVADALNSRGRAIKGSRILLLGVAYKKDVDDLRESPALEILAQLQVRGGRVDFSDPFVPRLPAGAVHGAGLESVALTAESIRQYDLAVLVTDHSDFPYPLIHREAAHVVDTRNAFRSRGLRGEHVVRA